MVDTQNYNTREGSFVTEMMDVQFKQAIKDIDSVVSTIYFCNNLSHSTETQELIELLCSTEWDNLFWTRDGFSAERKRVASEYKDLLLRVEVEKNPKKLSPYMMELCEICYPLLDEQARILLLKKFKKACRSYSSPDLELQQFGLAGTVSDGVPKHYREIVFGAMMIKFKSHRVVPGRRSQQSSHYRAPRSHHRADVSVRGGDSGDDESGESDPPAPPLSWWSCPYHRLPSHNPQLLEPLQLFPCGDVSRGRYRRRSFVVDSGRCSA